MCVNVLVVAAVVVAAGLLVAGAALAAPPYSSCFLLFRAALTAVFAAALRQDKWRSVYRAGLLSYFLMYSCVSACTHAEVKNIVCRCNILLQRWCVPPLLGHLKAGCLVFWVPDPLGRVDGVLNVEAPQAVQLAARKGALLPQLALLKLARVLLWHTKSHLP